MYHDYSGRFLLGAGLSPDPYPHEHVTRDKILWSGLIVVGSYGSYALGANNVAIATGIFPASSSD